MRGQLDLDNVANPFQCYSFFTFTRHSVQHSAYVVTTIEEQKNRTTQKESLCYTGPAAYKALFSTQYATNVFGSPFVLCHLVALSVDVGASLWGS